MATSSSSPDMPTRRKSLAFVPNNAGRHPEEMYDIDKKVVGSGAFGSVKTGRSKKTQQIVALKYIEKRMCKDLKVLHNEIDINKSMDHPNIARLYETFEDNQLIYIAMELCSGGEMFDLIIDQGHFDEAHASILMQQIFRAVNYMHDHGIAHRDLKPENFLIKQKLGKGAKIDRNTQVKVIDFGIAKRFDRSQGQGKMNLTTKAGTAYYLAPEVLSGRYNEKCDVWSCGVILYILLSGSPPFGGDDDAEIFQSIKSGKIYFDLDEFKGVSNDVKQLILHCCCKDVAKRYSAQQAVNSDWLKLQHSERGVSREESNDLKCNLIAKFKNFGSANRFQKAARHIIAHHLSDDVLRKLQNQFCSMDKDNNGELTLDELKDGCREMGILDTKDIGALFESIDADHSGTVSYSEFLAATMDAKQFMKREVYWEAFRVFDLDQNGRITTSEFEQIMQNDGADLNLPAGTSAKEIAAMFKEADADGDGEIDFQEFCQMMDK